MLLVKLWMIGVLKLWIQMVHSRHMSAPFWGEESDFSAHIQNLEILSKRYDLVSSDLTMIWPRQPIFWVRTFEQSRSVSSPGFDLFKPSFLSDMMSRSRMEAFLQCQCDSKIANPRPPQLPISSFAFQLLTQSCTCQQENVQNRSNSGKIFMTRILKVSRDSCV